MGPTEADRVWLVADGLVAGGWLATGTQGGESINSSGGIDLVQGFLIV